MIHGSSHIRAATLGDFDQVAHLIADAHAAHHDGQSFYEPASVRYRLNQVWTGGGQVFVTEQDGALLACGAITPLNVMARHTWTLSLGATRSEMQGKGLGHHLVAKRLEIAFAEGAGVVLVSSRDPDRWRRYDFRDQFVNPVTGAHLLALQLRWGE